MTPPSPDGEQPEEPVAVPEPVAASAQGSRVRCVWRNGEGGLTFQLPELGRFVKWSPPDSRLSLPDEAERLRWAHRFTPVPQVLDTGTADDGSTWLLTAALPGTAAVSDRWTASPRVAVRAIGEGLRAFHEAVPVATCPWTWTPADRLARSRAAGGPLLRPSRWHDDHRHLDDETALAILADPPPHDRTVVCHGDACAPNTLIDEDGTWSGHVDLGRLGIADRWADLAVATWAARWNYGPGWEGELLAAYGVADDDERTRYYRLLWDVAD